MKTELILLAAGQSKRFGGIKQLADIRGQAMICHCLSQYREGKNWIDGIHKGLVVLGANSVEIKKVLPAGINNHVIKSWQNGMGHTLAQSFRYISQDTTHLLVGLADQVLITQTMIQTLLSLANSHPQFIVAAKYRGSLGVPAVFPKRYFQQLSELSGDSGAKEILLNNSTQIISIDMPQAAFDIDTPEDLNLL